ncbi:MAG: serine/threonine protein kinase [Deltaproteobacteria bacterium]|nr:serine/threonine protein kinase [Deltaproteobacteria bacterium]
MLQPGDLIELWAVDARLGGEGGTAFLAHLGEDPAQKVVVKLLSPREGRVDLMRDRLLRDARALLNLEHPGLPRILSLRLTGQLPNAVMEHIPGEPLSNRVPGLPLNSETAVAFVRELCKPIQALHSVGLRHRDIKPANILLRPGQGPALVDLGLPAAIAPPRRSSWPYVPPEWLSDRQPSDSSLWDMYSLGVVLYELLRGKLVYAGHNVETREEMLALKKAYGPLDPGREVPVDLRRVVRRLTHPDPRKRIRRVEELLARLDAMDLERAEPSMSLDGHTTFPGDDTVSPELTLRPDEPTNVDDIDLDAEEAAEDEPPVEPPAPGQRLEDPIAPPLPRRVVKPEAAEKPEDDVPPADIRWVAFLMAALTVLGLLLAAYFTRPFFTGGP